MTVSVILPVAGQRVVTVTRLQRQVVGERDQDGHQVGVERGPVLPFRLALVVALELAGALNLPHADRPSDR